MKKAALMFLIAVVMVMSTSCTKRDDILTVVYLNWERSIDIEKYGLSFEVGWSLPDGAKLLDKNLELRYSDSYAYKYYYEIEKWQHERTVTTIGENDSPFWGEVDLFENEREASRSGKYILQLRDDDSGKFYNYSLSYDKWREYSVGDKVKTRIAFDSVLVGDVERYLP